MSEESVFEKSVSLKAKTASELFGEEGDVVAAEDKTQSEDKKCEREENSSNEKNFHSKKSMWKNALRNPSPLGEPHLPPDPVSGRVEVEEKEVPKIDIKYDFSKRGEKFDNMSISGCRETLIPVLPILHTSPPTPVQEDAESSFRSSPAVQDEEDDFSSAYSSSKNLVLIVHGVMSNDESLASNLQKTREAFEQVRYQWFKDDPEAACHIELINWKAGVIGIQSCLFDRIIPRGSLPVESRAFVAYSISDVAFYLTPSHCELIKSLVASLLNERFEQLISAEKKFKKVTLVGYSLGSVILHDILMSSDQYPLRFEVGNLFLWGSPLAAYLSVKDAEFQSGKFTLPNKVNNLFNIYHPHDPVAFRIEPLYYHLDSEVSEAEKIPNWETEGLKKVFSWFKGEEKPLVPKRRFDFVLQETVAESLSHQFSMLTAHHSYWSSRDAALFMLRRIVGNNSN